MRAILNFIVTPMERKYETSKKVGNVNLLLALSKEEAKNVSKRATVVSLPPTYKGGIKKGDELLIHHNIFRDYYDHSGKLKSSRAHIYDDYYHAIPEEIFVYKRDGEWKANEGWTFVEPITEDNISVIDKGGLPHTGRVAFSNVHPIGEVVGFKPESEYPVEIDGKTYFRMRDKNICIYDRLRS